MPDRGQTADPVRNCVITPKEIVRLMREFRERRLEFLGIYCSHLLASELAGRERALAQRHRTGLLF